MKPHHLSLWQSEWCVVLGDQNVQIDQNAAPLASRLGVPHFDRFDRGPHRRPYFDRGRTVGSRDRRMLTSTCRRLSRYDTVHRAVPRESRQFLTAHSHRHRPDSHRSRTVGTRTVTVSSVRNRDRHPTGASNSRGAPSGGRILTVRTGARAGGKI